MAKSLLNLDLSTLEYRITRTHYANQQFLDFAVDTVRQNNELAGNYGRIPASYTASPRPCILGAVLSEDARRAIECSPADSWKIEAVMAWFPVVRAEMGGAGLRFLKELQLASDSSANAVEFEDRISAIAITNNLRYPKPSPEYLAAAKKWVQDHRHTPDPFQVVMDELTDSFSKLLVKSMGFEKISVGFKPKPLVKTPLMYKGSTCTTTTVGVDLADMQSFSDFYGIIVDEITPFTEPAPKPSYVKPVSSIIEVENLGILVKPEGYEKSMPKTESAIASLLKSPEVVLPNEAWLTIPEPHTWKKDVTAKPKTKSASLLYASMMAKIQAGVPGESVLQLIAKKEGAFA